MRPASSGGSGAGMFKHILLASDGSEAARPAVQLAARLAREHGARLTAVTVIDPYPYLGIGQSNPLGFQAYMAEAHAQAARTHAKIEAMCQAEARPIELQLRLLENVAPAAGIIQTARDEQADLIVIGSHGRSGIARLVLGSVATRVVAESPVPVLVAR